MIKENFNVDVKYPHDYDADYATKIYNVSREYSFYDYLIFFMIFGLALIVGYNMIDSMQEKGYMLIIVFFIGFCALLS